jgi:hypothetical protein
MRGNSPVRFGKRPTEKDPSHGHLAGGLFHSGRGRRKRTRTAGTSLTAHFTLKGTPTPARAQLRLGQAVDGVRPPGA